MPSPYDRDQYGVRVRSTMIYERTLELSHKLCWNSEDLGLSRIHFHSGQTFSSRSALEAFCRRRGEDIPEPTYFFDWLPPIKNRSGVARQDYLRDEHWCNREQIVNILFDTAMQAYQKDAQQLLGSLTGDEFGHAELVKIDIKNQARQYTGAPDSAFVDLQNGTIALVEIKVGTSTTKYSLDQAVKYETLSALLTSDRFYPGFRAHNLLLCPSGTFSANTSLPHLIGPSTDSEGTLHFSYDPSALAGLKPEGSSDISSLVRARMDKITKGTGDVPIGGSFGLARFFSWRTVERHTPPGLLRANITALMRYLAPSNAGT